MSKPTTPSSQGPSTVETLGAALAGRRVLLLDPTHTLPDLLRGVQGVMFTIGRFGALDAGYLADSRPDAILAPLVGQDYDVLDLTRRLQELGFKGALRAYCRPLPNTRLVRAEVAHIWPELDFEIFEVPALGAE